MESWNQGSNVAEPLSPPPLDASTFSVIFLERRGRAAETIDRWLRVVGNQASTFLIIGLATYRDNEGEAGTSRRLGRRHRL